MVICPLAKGLCILLSKFSSWAFGLGLAACYTDGMTGLGVLLLGGVIIVAWVLTWHLHRPGPPMRAPVGTARRKSPVIPADWAWAMNTMRLLFVGFAAYWCPWAMVLVLLPLHPPRIAVPFLFSPIALPYAAYPLSCCLLD